MIRHTQTADGTPMQIVTCDGAGCPIKVHALGAPAVERAERSILRPDGTGRHYCSGCTVLPRVVGVPQFPHPEHG